MTRRQRVDAAGEVHREHAVGADGGQQERQAGERRGGGGTSVRRCPTVSGAIGEVKRVVAHVGRHNKVGPGPGWQPMSIAPVFNASMAMGLLIAVSMPATTIRQRKALISLSVRRSVSLMFS